MISGTVQGIPSFTAKTDLGAAIRIKVSTDATTPATVEIAGASDKTAGFSIYAAKANDLIAVRPITDPGIQQAVAAGNITQGAEVYAAADGKVAATGTVLLSAVALEGGVADDIINIIFVSGIASGV
jgi:murein DD-endopeptidase MepM/ murein hydrolase activator NlpD